MELLNNNPMLPQLLPTSKLQLLPIKPKLHLTSPQLIQLQLHPTLPRLLPNRPILHNMVVKK
jgi:hypothetical protein